VPKLRLERRFEGRSGPPTNAPALAAVSSGQVSVPDTAKVSAAYGGLADARKLTEEGRPTVAEWAPLPGACGQRPRHCEAKAREVQ
jgi:hypothetical protein